MSNGALLYFLFGTVLFFFWVYGIVSFIVDVRRRIVPRIRARWVGNDGKPSQTDTDPDPDPETEQLRELHGESKDGS